MSDTRTTSILQRVPAILAVTANSYGLSLQAERTRKPTANGDHRQRNGKAKDSDKSAAHR
jgi:hypothetical protein